MLLVSLPADEPDRSRVGRALARELVALAHRAPEGRARLAGRGDQRRAAATDPAAPFLLEAGFAATAMGLQLRVARRRLPPTPGELAGAIDQTAGTTAASPPDEASPSNSPPAPEILSRPRTS